MKSRDKVVLDQPPILPVSVKPSHRCHGLFVKYAQPLTHIYSLDYVSYTRSEKEHTAVDNC